LIKNENFDDTIKFYKEKFMNLGRKIRLIAITALFYKLTPSKILVMSVRSGIKKNKNRVTVLLTCNMTGKEKLKPVIV
jgi:hypothetical protein